MTGARAARLVVALAIGLAPAACSQSATPLPRSSPSSLRPSIAASASLAPPSTPPPTAPAAGLADWRRLPPQSGLREAGDLSVAFNGDRFLGVGCITSPEGCGQPAIWESDDGLAWRTAGPVFLPPDSTSGVVLGAVSSRFGTLAVGSVGQGDRSAASIWLRDAGGWTQFSPPSAADSWISELLATDGRVIAVGSGPVPGGGGGFRSWWSADGTTWQAASSPQDQLSGGNPIDLFPVGDALLAWGISFGDPEFTLWWRTLDGTAWQQVEAPGGLAGAYITAIGRRQGGFEAFGWLGGGDLPIRPAAWIADESGADWRPVEPPPSTAVRYHLPVGQGSVAAGSGPPGPGREHQTGLVWLRGPGETTWRVPVIIPDFDVLALIQDPDQLNRVIVIGRTFEGLQESVGIWTGLVDWAP